MNLIEASGILFKYFSEDNNYLVLPDDFKKLQLLSQTPELDILTFKESLKEFVSSNLIRHIEFDEKEGKQVIKKDFYVLVRSFSAVEKSITVSAEICSIISSTINGFIGQNDKKNVCDPKNIAERDIENLLGIIDILIRENNQFKNAKQ